MIPTGAPETSVVRYLPFTALAVFISVRALKRGFGPGSNDLKHWYDRAINATGGIVILAFWAFLLFAVPFGPQPSHH
jgi:hypothetical protein